MTLATREQTVAVLGPRDSAVPAVAEALIAAAEQSATEQRAAGEATRFRVLINASPADRPDCAVLVVDAVCPIRPDDLEVARAVATQLPLVITLAGRTSSCTPHALATTVDVTARRLADAGVQAPVHVFHDDCPGSAAPLIAALLNSVSSSSLTTPLVPAPAPPAATGSTIGTVDWLLARRTEAITTRSYSLRQDVQSLRIEAVQDLHRSVRDLSGRARQDFGTARRGQLTGRVTALTESADTAISAAIARTDNQIDVLIGRHLGPTAPTMPRIAPPGSGITPGHPPRNLGEESLVLLMGVAGGTGVGRMILTPFIEVPGIASAVLPLALLCGTALGCVTVMVRRTQTLRSHTIAVVSERLAGLRTDAEQTLGARILAAEALITDGFAHNPGPRVADVERRIRHLRATARPTSSEFSSASTSRREGHSR